MLAGVRAHIPNRVQILVILGLLFSFPVMAQNSQTRARATAAAANEPTKASDAQGTAEQDTMQQSEPTVTQPVKRSAPNSAKSAGSGWVKPSGSATAKNVAPAPAEPVLPIVPPPPPPSTETSTLAAPARTETRSTAEQVTEKTETTAPVQGLGWAEMVKTVGSVGLIICLILGGYMLFRKFAPQYMTKRPNERDIRLIETLPMGDKRSIVVVQACAQRFLLACTPGQITLLTALHASAGTAAAGATNILESQAATAFPSNFRNFYEQEKKASPARPSVVKALPPDIRGKMLELRKALEG